MTGVSTSAPAGVPATALTAATPADSPGQVGAFGDATALGSPGAGTAAPAVGMAATPSGHGYWVTGADGGVFSYGDAGFYGSTGGMRLAQPIVGMAATVTGHGYWLVAADGGVFSFGDAHFYGSTGAMRLAQPIVGMAANPTGDGYWLVAADGGIFTFGGAHFYGSAGAEHLAAPVIGMTALPGGDGYRLMAADGGVFTYGAASFRGSLAPEPAGTSVVGTASTPTGAGYWMVTAPARTPAAAPSGTVTAASTSVGSPLGSFEITCYDLSGTTASGAPTSMSTVAVDPSVIPLGSSIYIAGVGTRVAQDTGGAIQGHRLDLWMPTYSDCVNWGVQYRDVWLRG